jgi:hypothetical protein
MRAGASLDPHKVAGLYPALFALQIFIVIAVNKKFKTME